MYDILQMGLSSEWMAAKRRSSRRIGRRGPGGLRGHAGKPGRRGHAGTPANGGALAELAAQMELVTKELKIQFTRMAQIQAQIDQMARGEPVESTEPLRLKRRMS
jgi:hypothetical protein